MLPGGSVGLSMYNHRFPGFPCPASWRLQPRLSLSRGGLAGTIPTSPAAPWAQGPECPLRGWAPAIPSRPAGLRALAVEQRCPSPRLPHGLSPRHCCTRLLSRHTSPPAQPRGRAPSRCPGAGGVRPCPAASGGRGWGGAPFQPCPTRKAITCSPESRLCQTQPWLVSGVVLGWGGVFFPPFPL